MACDLYPLLPPPTTRFYVNLLCGEGPGGEAALHFNPRLDESTVVFNSLEQGTWGREERGSGIPFQHGQPFDVLLIATEEGFKVSPCHPQARAPRPPPRLQSRQVRKALGGGRGQRPGQGGAHVRSVPLLPLAQAHVCPKARVWPWQGPGGKGPAPGGWVAPSGKRGPGVPEQGPRWLGDWAGTRVSSGSGRCTASSAQALPHVQCERPEGGRGRRRRGRNSHRLKRASAPDRWPG